MIVKRYSNADIDWNIGSLYAHDDFVWKVLRVCNEINESSNISHVFGSIPCVLQGGRIPPRDASISDALDIIDTYNSLGVGCRFTFSSTIITDEDLNDDMSNQILSRIEENNFKYEFACRCICKNAENYNKKIPTYEEIGVKPNDMLVMNFE